MNLLSKLAWVLVILLVIPSQAFCLSKDSQEKLLLTSATAQLNLETGISVYEGDVSLEQGTTYLQADKLILHTDKQNQLQQATAYGKPARYRTLPQLNKAELHANAEIIEYYPSKDLIVLLGYAEVYQQHNIYKGPRIEYNTKLQTVLSPVSKEGRTTIIIQQKSAQAYRIHKEAK